MSIETDLKKDGIEVIEQLDTMTINSIAKNVATKICDTFPNYGYTKESLFISLSKLGMYTAKMPERNVRSKLFL